MYFKVIKIWLDVLIKKGSKLTGFQVSRNGIVSLETHNGFSLEMGESRAINQYESHWSHTTKKASLKLYCYQFLLYDFLMSDKKKHKRIKLF